MEHFLNTLLQTGQPALTPGNSKPEVWVQEQLDIQCPSILGTLQTLHQEQLLSLPGPPLELDEKAAFCGLQTLFILTSATAFREFEILQVKSWLSSTAVPLSSPEAYFSADLCLRDLPDLRKTIAQIADGDPLLKLIDHLGSKLPLSSVGLALEAVPDLTMLNSHPGLAQFHAERVIERSDHSRASESSVASLIDAMAGAHKKILFSNFPTHTS